MYSNSICIYINNRFIMKYISDKREGYARTSAYRGTVTSKNDSSLLAIKSDTHARNKNAREYIKRYFKIHGKTPAFINLERVQLMARGPRTKHSLNDFGTRRSYDQSLPHRYATHYDVYVRRDSYAEWLLQYQLENNLTPSQWNYIQKMQRRKMWLEVEMAKELRKKGIQSFGTRTGTKYKGV